MKWNENKITFIICSNCSQIMNESKKYIENLYIPNNMEIEIKIIENAYSMAEGYNKAILESDAKYKIYMHQDVFIINRYMLKEVIEIFKTNTNVGMLGVIGCKNIPHNGIWWDGECVGETLEDRLENVTLLKKGNIKQPYESVQAIDGQLIATQYDMPWREDICKGWHFYDTSQSIEFLKSGYKVGVARQEKTWLIHECGYDINVGYEDERIQFLKEYKDFLISQDTNWEEKIAILINNGEWVNAKEQMEIYCRSNTNCNDTLCILQASIHLNFGDREKAFECIQRGLSYNYKNYELYLMLGNYYLEENKNKAFLCYQNSEYYCNTSDIDYIRQVKEKLVVCGKIIVNPVSIIILSYNKLEMTSLCIDSIKQNNLSDTYEIIVIDNGSKDGSAEWLLGQKDLKVICNKANRGFPVGCNQGILLAHKENDIFLLNNDTIVPPNAIFWLRMGLYENDKVGASGSVSNYAGNNQMVQEKKNNAEEYYQYGIENNIPLKYPYEKKVWLMGFAVLFKRNILEKVGYLDERFSPGNYEDNDIGLRFLEAGYHQLLCKNSFIYHFGSVGFRKNQKAYEELLTINRKKLNEKYHMEAESSSWVRTDLLELIQKKKEEQFSVLDVGCAFGATLAKIESEFPNCIGLGIELNERAAKMGNNLVQIIQGDIEKMDLSILENRKFDYIMFGNILEYLLEPIPVIKKCLPYLEDCGKVIISISRVIVKSEEVVTFKEEEIYEMLTKCKGLKFKIEKVEKNKKVDFIFTGKKL